LFSFSLWRLVVENPQPPLYLEKKFTEDHDSNDSVFICSLATPWDLATSPVKSIMAFGPQLMKVALEKSLPTTHSIISRLMRPCQKSFAASLSLERVT
jgi:hypothetical protein